MLNIKREYFALEEQRFLYQTSFKDKSRCYVYGRKKFVTEAGEEQFSAHAFPISKDFWTITAGQLDFTNYVGKIWEDYLSVVIVEHGEYTAPSINFGSMGDITPENLQELSEYTTKHLSDLEKRIVEDYLFIDEGTAENIGLPNLPENHFWVRKNGVIVGVNIDYIKNDYDHFVKELEKDFNNFYDITFKKIKETVLKYYKSFFEQAKADLKNQSDIEVGKVTAEGEKQLEILNQASQGLPKRVDNLERNKLEKVNTIAELQSRKNLKVGDIVEVLGYYTAGDGAGHKRIIANEDDGSGVQLKNGLWANIVHNGEVNVSWFGAKGDGVTDDTSAFEKAMNYINTIYIDKNIFVDRMELKDNITIYGKKIFINTLKYGDNCTIKDINFSSKDDTPIIIDSKGNEKCIKQFLTFENCSFDNVTFKLWEKTNSKFVNCEFKNFRNTAIWIGSENGFVECENCNFYNGIPKVDEYNSSDAGKRTYGFNCFSIMNPNISLKVKNCNFKDVIKVLFCNNLATNSEILFENNNLKNTFDGFISSNSAVSGLIKNNILKNIGLLRCNGSGLLIDNPNKGVGCSAIYMPSCVEVDVIGNTIINALENGIEGSYKSVIGNLVANTGYKHSEGFTTPSTECFYINSPTVINNTAINPYNKNAFIIIQFPDYKFKNAIIDSNVAKIDNPINQSAFLFQNFDTTDVIVKNNSQFNFNSLYSSNTKCKGFKIIDGNFESLNNPFFKETEYISNSAQKYFLLLDSKELQTTNCKVSEIIYDDNVKCVHVVSNDEYCKIKFSFTTNFAHKIISLKGKIKSDNNIKISVASRKNNIIMPTDKFGIYGGYETEYPNRSILTGEQMLYTFTNNEYKIINAIFPAFGTNIDVIIYVPKVDQNLYLQFLEVSTFDN